MTGIFEITSPKKIKGQFCLGAFRLYCENKNVSFDSMLNTIASSDLFAMSDLVYYACKAYAELNDRKFNITELQFTNIFAEIPEKEMSALIAKLSDAKLYGNKTIAQSTEEETSKKK